MPTVTIKGLDALKRETTRLSDAVATRLARNSAMSGARVAAAKARQIGPDHPVVLGQALEELGESGAQYAPAMNG
jgi:hypothetical protein